ncbi:unnamed protein product [Arctogadus glacialis]
MGASQDPWLCAALHKGETCNHRAITSTTTTSTTSTTTTTNTTTTITTTTITPTTITPTTTSTTTLHHLQQHQLHQPQIADSADIVRTSLWSGDKAEGVQEAPQPGVPPCPLDGSAAHLVRDAV